MYFNYLDSDVMVITTIPYYMVKTRVMRTDVYFNGDRSEGRMGGQYMINMILFDTYGTEGFFQYQFYHLVVDDESSYCLPFIDPGENW